MPLVKGEAVRAYVDREGRARSELRFTNTNVDAVKKMFLSDHPNDFFPGASAANRRSLPGGGQEMDENPLGGPPIMHTRIEPTARGVRSEFTGLIKGGAELQIYERDGYTHVSETTSVKPNLRAIPVAGQMMRAAEAVPFFGGFARMSREVAEEMGGTVFAGIHASKVGPNAVPAMAQTLSKKR